MRVLDPITTWEFVGMLKDCMPPGGWPKTLAVANSGGPDSTCLLFLLSTLLSQHPKPSTPKIERCFDSLVSLTVDHQLQECSSAMSDHAAHIAASLGTEHLTVKIPWSTPPYVRRPEPGTPIESVARDARYSVLLESMNRAGAEAIAFGHHADDQVETFLMRIIKGTSALGLGGMKPVRRFGMGVGGPGKMGWFGYIGMNRWIVRPLLGVSKERILATCEVNKLDYVTDLTNFQPELTLRNALRHVLSQKSANADSAFDNNLEKLRDQAKTLGVAIDLSLGPEPLRELVEQHSKDVRVIESQGHKHLVSCVLPSPPSSILLSTDDMARIRDPSVRLAMVTSVLRYVSPRPWGSSSAEASRNLASLNLIISNIWADDPGKSKPFSAGSSVLWTPVTINSEGQIRMKSVTPSQRSHAWLATRAPPYRKAITTHSAQLDITSQFKRYLQDPTAARIMQVLYDCRFLITLDLAAIPHQHKQSDSMDPVSCRLMIVPSSRYHLPRIVLGKSSENRNEDVELATLPCRAVAASENVPVAGGFSGVTWASWEFVRKLSTDGNN